MKVPFPLSLRRNLCAGEIFALLAKRRCAINLLYSSAALKGDTVSLLFVPPRSGEMEIIMFTETSLTVEILSVSELSWTADKRFSTPRPYHALSYRLTGGADFIHKNTVTHVQKGDIAFVPADYNYELDSKSEHLYVIHFTADKLLDKKMRVFTPSNANYIKSLFMDMHRVWHGKQIGYQYAAASVFYRIMEQITKQYARQRLLSSSDKMLAVIEYIHENFTDSTLSIAYLAEMADMSDTYFRKLFVRHFSLTPLKYINNLRISYAEELLRTGYYSVEYVAEKAGFNDPKYFSTVVKKSMGLPPSALYEQI